MLEVSVFQVSLIQPQVILVSPAHRSNEFKPEKKKDNLYETNYIPPSSYPSTLIIKS